MGSQAHLYNPAGPPEEQVVFPVDPMFKAQDTSVKVSWSVAKRGGISRPHGRNERTYTFTADLPGPAFQDERWVHDWRPPQDIVDQLVRWHAPSGVATEGVRLKFVVAGDRAVSEYVYISDMGQDHNGGYGGITLNLTLTEHRALVVRMDGEQAVGPQGGNTGNGEGDAAKPAPPETPDTYAIQADDTFWSIAQTQLGDGSRWQEIADLNPDMDPDNLQVGDVVNLPTAGNGQADSGDQGGTTTAAGDEQP